MYKQHYAIKHQLIARQQMLLVGIMGIKKAGVIAPDFISTYISEAIALCH
jgi:tetrahydromethanopterin S-methyltransferase subunit F